MTTTPISRSSVAAVQLRRPLLRRLLDPCRRLVAFRRQPPLGRILVPGLHVEPPQRTFHGGARRWLTNAQVAVSTGTSGNSSVPNNYEHLALVSGGLDYYGDAGMAPSQPGSEDLGWEKTLDFEPRLPPRVLEPTQRRPRILQQTDHRHAHAGAPILCPQGIRILLGQHRRDGQPRRRNQPLGYGHRRQGLHVDAQRQRLLQQKQDRRTLQRRSGV